jgi:hypothetical protein
MHIIKYKTNNINHNKYNNSNLDKIILQFMIWAKYMNKKEEKVRTKENRIACH